MNSDMRSPDVQQLGMFAYVSIDERVPEDHPTRPLRALMDKLLEDLDPVFEKRYSAFGRPSIPPERLLRASLLQVVYSVRSERLLMEQLNYNLVFRWFVGLNMDDQVWDHSTFSFNRDRLFDDELAQRFFGSTVLHAQVNGLVSSEHFSVDGTLLQAWASHRSFRPKDRGGDGDGGDFRGQRRCNETHESTTDPDARLARKGAGKESKLSYQAVALMENRNGLAVGTGVWVATGTAECEGALDLIDEMQLGAGCSVDAEKGFDRESFVNALIERKIRPHVARSTRGRRSAVPDKIARTKGYAKSQVVRKRIESIFGWAKVIGGLRKLAFTGLTTVRGHVAWVFAAYNLIRLGGMEGWWVPAPTRPCIHEDRSVWNLVLGSSCTNRPPCSAFREALFRRPMGLFSTGCYATVHSDNDALIDGQEFLLGTKVDATDSDRDGTCDDVEYPVAAIPVSDPCSNGQCNPFILYSDRFESRGVCSP